MAEGLKTRLAGACSKAWHEATWHRVGRVAHNLRGCLQWSAMELSHLLGLYQPLWWLVAGHMRVERADDSCRTCVAAALRAGRMDVHAVSDGALYPCRHFDVCVALTGRP
jgi:hypothetical protein